MKEQPKDKKHVIKIMNLPRQANETLILKMLSKKVKGLKYEQFSLEKDTKKRQNSGTAYLSTTDNETIRHLLNLHYHVSILGTRNMQMGNFTTNFKVRSF